MAKKYDKSHGPQIPKRARISPSPVRPMRILGSYSSKMLLKRREDEEPPEEPPPPPPPPVSAPDLAFQFSPCLEAIPTPPGYDLKEEVINAVREAVGDDADVRYLCLEATGRIGVWLRPFVTDADSQARDRGLERINILRAGETFAFFINSALIRRNALEAWNKAPKRLNGHGQPDPGGPIHLTGFSISFASPNRVVTRVDGFDERPWPDVSFQLITTDTLSISAGEVQCQSEAKLDADTTWLNVLTGIFLFLGTVLSPVFLLPATVFLVQSIIVGSVDAPDANAGAGCGAAQLIPREILIEGGQKLITIYNRVDVTSGGIFAGGIAFPVPRMPAVAISGKTQIAADPGTTSVTRSYSIVPDDLLPPLQITWTANAVVLNPGAETTSIQFNIEGAQPGQVLTRQVAVRVTDRDNLNAQSEVSVQIHMTFVDPDLPPICRAKPWLPQCQEPVAQALQRREQPKP